MIEGFSLLKGRIERPAANIDHKRQTKSQMWQVEIERQLVLRAARGDPSAFALLYDRFVDRIYRYIYYRVPTRADAEDLTAQVFLKAWEAIGHYDWTGRPFGAWLYRIAHNLVIDGFRRRRDASSLEEVSFLEDKSEDVDEKVQIHLTGEYLRAVLKCLTPDQQNVIVLRFLEGYSTAKVATLMDKAEGSVRTLQHRALRRLKKLVVRA